MDIEYYKNQAELKHKEHKKFLEGLKKKTPKNLDYVVAEKHEETFQEIDCLTCGNCCKTTGPLFTDKDKERIAKHLKMKIADFEDKFLRIDEDDDWVLKTTPCYFFDHNDNKCNIYDVRPKACREYPHTDRKKIFQINHLTLKNTPICPATYVFVEKLRQVLEK